MTEYKVIFHIDEIGKWELLLRNVNNLLKVEEDNKLHIEVLANSDAVKLYVVTLNTDDKSNIMKTLNEKGVKFVACNNALNELNILKDTLNNFVEIVPAGIMELVKKQSEGYLYIKP